MGSSCVLTHGSQLQGSGVVHVQQVLGLALVVHDRLSDEDASTLLAHLECKAPCNVGVVQADGEVHNGNDPSGCVGEKAQQGMKSTNNQLLLEKKAGTIRCMS